MGGGVQEPLIFADVICEQPLKIGGDKMFCLIPLLDVEVNLAVKGRIVGGGRWVENPADRVRRLPPLLLIIPLPHQTIRCILAVEAQEVVVVVHESARLADLWFVPPPKKI